MFTGEFVHTCTHISAQVCTDEELLAYGASDATELCETVATSQ